MTIWIYYYKHIFFVHSFRFTPVPSFKHTISFQVRKRIAVFPREPLPDDFIPPPPQMISFPPLLMPSRPVGM